MINNEKKAYLRLIALIGAIVPRRLRADWRQEWEAELRHREALLALITSLFFGLAPAWQASKPDLVTALREGAGAEGQRSRRSQWFSLRNALVVAQIAVSLVLLVSAGLFTRSLQFARHLDPGFEIKDRLTLEINLQTQGYDEAKGQTLARRAVERLSALPGVASASVVNTLPLGLRGDAAPGVLPARAARDKG